MRAGLYARVSTERQADRGTIGSQLQLLRQHISGVGDELVGEYVDDGHSGARLDRPGLDALRDAAEAGLIERVWCLSPDRLARAYAYQVLVLDELDRFGITVAFTDSPGLTADDPQSVLLTQVQGVIAEYEKAKIAERYRRGKLFRARAGEIVTWKASYGYRRIPRSTATGAAHHEIYEPEATVVRRIFTDRAAGISVREICRRLNADGVPSPTGKPTWGTSTLCRLLRNEAYIGRVYYNRTESVPDRRPTRRHRQVPRDRDEWIPIECPRIISDDLFQAAGHVATDNTKWSPRRAEPGQWLLKGLVKCGVCGVGTRCHKMRGRNGTWHRYYHCRNHDPIRAGGESRRCPERNIRADALDAFVFDHIRTAITQPDLLLAGEQAVTLTTPTPDDELLAAELARLDRKLDATNAERRRLIDLYQGGFIELPEMQRRATEIAARRKELQHKRTRLADERATLARDNQLRSRVHDFAARIHAVIDTLDDTQKQQLLRLLIEDVRVTGWHVEIRLRIALDPPPPEPPHPTGPTGKPSPPRPVSTQDGLRSVGEHRRPVLPPTPKTHTHPLTPRTQIRMLEKTTRWSHPHGNSVVPSSWQMTVWDRGAARGRSRFGSNPRTRFAVLVYRDRWEFCLRRLRHRIVG
ncbi:MAG TPA: recombinase family protein [Mycobacterium sp.]|nr:recombinase family protein [Mycobacterium sp.]